jgi:hypothetical protein
MVVAVLVHVVFIVLERYITLVDRPFPGLTRARAKLLLQGLVVVLLVVFCWVYVPLARGSYHQLRAAGNPALQAYFVIASFYLYFSANQIRDGYPLIKLEFNVLSKCTTARYYGIWAATMVPFLLEIKLLMDWAFSKTSLSFDDWITHFTIQYALYRSKFQSLGRNSKDAIQPWYSKAVVGWCGFTLILCLIFVPMVLFSNLNPVSTLNLITSGTLSLGLRFDGGNRFPLF